jgi:seryl-tRNA synthetase
MLAPAFIRENIDAVRASITRREMSVDLDRWLKLDVRRTELIPTVETLRSKLKLSGKPTPEQLVDLQHDKQQLARHEEELKYIEDEWRRLLEDMPNLIAEGTPDGDETANVQVRAGGTKPEFDFTPLDHLALNEKMQFVDFETGAKVAGSRFYFLRGKGVRLWDAVQTLAKRELMRQGFELMYVPHMVNSRVAAGTGFLPRGEERQVYRVEGEDLNLIATAELPLTGLAMDDVLELARPQLLAASSPCYRLEAGAYGKFSKGLYRVHQFEKLEMYIYARPDDSEALLEKILAIEESLCEQMGIPYQVVRIAAGDLSAPAYKKYDVEYWSPVDNMYRELTSCSNCTDYQARRLNVRYRTSDGDLRHVHTINGTAVTSGRTLIAILENNQMSDGQVRLPKALADIYGEELL